MTSTHARSCSLTDKWPTKTGENPRKSPANGPPNLDGNWPRDLHAHITHNEDEENLPAIKSAEDIYVADLDGNANVHTLHEYENAHIEANVPPLKQRNKTVLRRGQRQTGDSPELSAPQALLAVQRLDRLKELQRRRDLTEKYYSQEIRRVIGEHYFGPRPSAPASRDNDQIITPPFYQYLENRPKSVLKTLEPCGTMTTITRLDCGCMQQTTRPIFTTTRGRVNKRPCGQSEEQVLLKLTPSGPREHLYTSLTTPRNLPYYAAKPRQRFPPNQNAYANVPPETNDETQDDRDERAMDQKPEIIGHSSRHPLPPREYTDTSSASL